MPAAMVMRHRPPHFQHVFAGDGYSSAYYSYLWSEVLDADGFAPSRRPATSSIPRSRGACANSSMPPATAASPTRPIALFRGRDPDPAALLDKRGLLAEPPGADA